MNLYFTADLHLGHNAKAMLARRGFDSADAMSETLIANINKAVKVEDHLFIIGDFCFDKNVVEWREKIHSKNVTLIRGNHDKQATYKYAAAFGGTPDLHEISRDAYGGLLLCPLVLCHYAMRTWNHSHYGSWHLYGHSHGHLPDDPNLMSFDVGADCHGLMPVSYQRVCEIMEAKPGYREYGTLQINTKEWKA